MDDQTCRELREHAWSYFVLHADQRLKTFHFYLIFATLIAGAIVTIVRDGKSFAAAGVLALLLAFLSFVFWKLDKRNKQLIKHGEDAIKLIERRSGLPDQGEEPHRLKLFLHEEYTSAKLKRFPHTWPWLAHFSYSTCFNAVFLVFGAGGLVAGVVFLFL